MQQQGIILLTAKVTDNSGTSSVSDPVAVTVVSNNSPVVSITGPLSGTIYSAPHLLQLMPRHPITGGTISKVDFYQGTT